MINYRLALPYLPSGIEIAKRFAQEEEKEKELDDEFYKIAGISRETVWIQRSPPGSGAPDLEVLCKETKDPSMTYREFATSMGCKVPSIRKEGVWNRFCRSATTTK